MKRKREVGALVGRRSAGKKRAEGVVLAVGGVRGLISSLAEAARP
jgi:hypothetical protein